MFARIAVDVPLHGAFTWRVPDELAPDVHRGVRVRVPWRGKIREGVVVGLDQTPPEGIAPASIRAIAAVRIDEAPIDDPQLALAEWMADYYHAPLGECVKLLLPGGIDDGSRARIELVDREIALPPSLTILRDLLVEAGGGEELELVARQTGLRLRDLREAESLGAVRLVDAAARTSWRPRTIDRVRRSGAAPTGRLGPVQTEVIAFLDEHGDSTSDELRELFSIDRAGLRALEKRGLVSLTTEEVHRDPFEAAVARRPGDPTLSTEQEAALDAIRARLGTGAATLLVRGVTGSGKTEVYIRAVRDVLEGGGRALILLPEIALTPQVVSVFRAALGDRIAVQHSGLSPAERRSQWLRIQRGELPVVIGARSAVFAPLGAPGLIVVDEEHDASFKQDTGVRYHGRDVALKLAQLSGACTVLGSATPSMESVLNAERGRFGRVDLHARPTGTRPPAIELVDMRAYPAAEGDMLGRVVSPPLQVALRDTWQAGEQSVLFLNRRGYAPVVSCQDCGVTIECSACDVGMTFHRRGNVVRCHYCGASERVPARCPTCGGASLTSEGVGTEQIELLLKEAFDGLRVVRLDADTARGRGLRSLLDTFRRGDADVLLGTQMVTKGHDFPRVTLVGVLNADQSLRFPDFRSAERTWQVITQVAGRAGRGALPGRVLVQTHTPEHPVLTSVVTGDFDGFAARELAYRRRLGYPPQTFAALVRLEGKDYGAVWRSAEEAAATLRRAGGATLRVTGPTDAPIARIAERFRVQVFARGAERGPLHRALRALGDCADGAARTVDVDPYALL